MQSNELPILLYGERINATPQREFKGETRKTFGCEMNKIEERERNEKYGLWQVLLICTKQAEYIPILYDNTLASNKMNKFITVSSE